MLKFILTALAVCFAVPVSAAQNCDSRETVIEQLSTKYSEQLQVGGLQKANGVQVVMEIWASIETGTYTVLMTNANDLSCIVAAGTDYFEAAPTVEAKPDDPT